jgi:hypothetical protein
MDYGTLQLVPDPLVTLLETLNAQLCRSGQWKGEEDLKTGHEDKEMGKIKM